MGPRLLFLPLRWRERVGTLDLHLELLKVPKLELVNWHRHYGGYGGIVGARIRYTSLLIHLVGGDLVDGVEKGKDLSGRRFHGVVDLVQSTYVTS
jgi:hypothetical protein